MGPLVSGPRSPRILRFMEVKKNMVVSIRYQLRNAAGEMLEDAFEGEPVALLQGQGNVISGLERALLGHRVGDEFEVTVPPQEGYGPRREGQLRRVSKKYFADAKRLRPGMQTRLRTERGAQTVTVVKVGGKVVDVDTNHPLAGETLTFKVRVVEVREATKSEIDHRHAHADGHDHH